MQFRAAGAQPADFHKAGSVVVPGKPLTKHTLSESVASSPSASTSSSAGQDLGTPAAGHITYLARGSCPGGMAIWRPMPSRVGWYPRGRALEAGPRRLTPGFMLPWACMLLSAQAHGRTGGLAVTAGTGPVSLDCSSV